MVTTPEALRAEPDGKHSERTIEAIRTALASVPFYAKAGLSAPGNGATLDEVLGALPLLTRAKIRPTLPKVWVPEGHDVKAELAAGSVSVVETGIAEGRVRVLFDHAWWRAQEARALAIHPTAAQALRGEMGPYRDAVLWVPEKGAGSCGQGDPPYEERLEGTRLHLNSRQDPTFWSELVMTRMLDELAHHGTKGILADPFYLDVLARHALSAGRELDAHGFVALTRALPTTAHKRAIGKAFDGPVFGMFGARATGVLFVEGDDGNMHHAPMTTHVELVRAKVETPGAKNVALVVVTTLGRTVQPLVRYVLGDLVQVADGPSRYTTVPPVASVEGTFDDAIVRPDGALVTAGAVDRALADVPNVQAYQVTQEARDALVLEVVGGSADDAGAALGTLVTGMKITPRRATSIAVESNGKYRATVRKVPASLSDVFEGVSS